MSWMSFAITRAAARTYSVYCILHHNTPSNGKFRAIRLMGPVKVSNSVIIMFTIIICGMQIWIYLLTSLSLFYTKYMNSQHQHYGIVRESLMIQHKHIYTIHKHIKWTLYSYIRKSFVCNNEVGLVLVHPTMNYYFIDGKVHYIWLFGTSHFFVSSFIPFMPYKSMNEGSEIYFSLLRFYVLLMLSGRATTEHVCSYVCTHIGYTDW